MKKSLIFCAALLASAFAFQSCDQVKSDNPATVDEVTYDLQKGMTLGDYIDKYAVDGIVTLPAGAVVNLDEEVVLNEAIGIISDEKNPATIVAKAGFVTNSPIYFSNVKIDATNVATPLVKMNTLPTEGLNDVGAFEIDMIVFDGVTVEGLKTQLFYANKQKYLVHSFAINNCTINRVGANKKSIMDFNGGGLPLKVTINKSTIESDATTVHNAGDFFTTQSGSNLAQVTSDPDAKQVFTITDNKFSGIAKGKNLCSLRQKNQAWQYYVIKNNVVADCGKSGQFIKGFCEGQNINKKENWEASGNVVTFDGNDVGAEENKVLEGACLVPDTPEAE